MRSAPKTRLARHLRRCERVITLLAILYVVLQAFPQLLFAHNLTTQGITVYSRAPLPPEAAACVTRAASLLRQSELALPGRQERIFVCNSPWMFQLFSPLNGSAFAYSVPLNDHIFIASADFVHNVARSSAPVYNTRSLSAVMAHEITHGLIRQRLGFFRGVGLPAWIAEGYCDEVAQEGSFPEAEGLRLMRSGQDHPSMSFRYFKDRQMVRYLMEDRHLSFAQVVARAKDAAAVETETRQALRVSVLP